MHTQTIPIDDLRRNFGAIKKRLPTTSFILTDRGNPIGILQAAPSVKSAQMEELFGAWKGTELDEEALWKNVAKKKSRKTHIRL